MSCRSFCRLARRFPSRTRIGRPYNVVSSFNTHCHRHFISTAKKTRSQPVHISSEIVRGDNYDILRKEASDHVTIASGNKLLWSLWISGGWVLPRNVNGDELKAAIQSALNSFPWLSSRITSLDSSTWTMHCNNQGIKMDTVCHPSLSVDPADGDKYDELQRAVRPERRNMFFTADKPHTLISKKKWDTAPVVTVQLNHLNVSNLDEVTPETPCVLTYKLNHGIGDGYTGYLFARYISDYLSGADLSGYDDAHYGRMLGCDDAQKMSKTKEEFKDEDTFGQKYGVKSDGSPTWIMPNFSLCRLSRFQMVLMNAFQYIAPYLVSMNMDYFELKFTPNDVAGIRNDLMSGFDDDHEFKKERLSTYECLTAYLSPLIAKYESSTGMLKRLMIPLNMRNRTTKFNKYSMGNCVNVVTVGVEDETGSMEYNASNFALKLHEGLNRYGRIQNDEQLTTKLTSLMRDYFSVMMVHGPRYSLMGTITEMLKAQSVMWNEFRSLKLYDNYRFGLDQRPLFYMYGVSYTGNRFMFLDDPNDPKAVRVFIRMPKGKAKKMREAETEFLQKYEVPADADCFDGKELIDTSASLKMAAV